MRSIIKVFTLCVVFLNFSVQAAMPELESYGKLETVSDMSISPNGELIAYRLTESDDKDFIVVFSLTEKKIIAAVNVKKHSPSRTLFCK